MDIKNLLSRIDGIVAEDSMKSAVNNPRGPKFGGYWKGTDPNPPKPGQGVGGEGEENLLKSFEKELKENPRRQVKRDLMKEYKEYVAEYGGVGGYGAASQAPQGSTAANPDPEELQAKLDQQQIQKSTNTLSPVLNAQGAHDPMNKVKFQDVMTKLDQTPNTTLGSQDQKQLGPLAVAASKALQDPQTANQLKQVITKADQLDQKKQMQVKQAKQTVGSNTPADQQQPAGQQQQQQQQPSAGKPQ